MDSGESTVAGMNGMRSWWKLDGSWPKDGTEQGLIGTTLASQLGVKIGDTVTLGKTISTGERNQVKVKITGIYDSGDSDNNGMYIPSIVAQTLANLPTRSTRSKSRR